MAQTEQTEHTGRGGRRWAFAGIMITAVLLLFGVPWWTLALGPSWPGAVFVVATVVLTVGAVALPLLMRFGHRRGDDRAARVGDTLLGVIWVLFAWSVLGILARIVLWLAGVDDPARSRIVAVAVLVIAAVLVAWGAVEAMRVPRIRRVDVWLSRLGPGLDGTTVALLADTHYGPIDRTTWSRRTAEAVNALAPDIVAHAGDIADGTATERREQAAPLGTIRARLAKVYVTGNHEYLGQAQGWLDHMTELGWQSLHNRHVVVERGGDRLVVAGIDDATAGSSGLPSHGADLAGALTGADADLPVLLLAHQPRQVAQTRDLVDLQVSGHTHGGQIWPFHYLVRIDQPTVHGLSRHGERTQLYTTRGAGFWGPPLRIFAPSEISLLTLRRALP
ncbi:metallophosphoesterase [Actinophytocola sediminis]